MVFICVLAIRGPGWVLQLVSTARIWNAGGNCSIRGATRRRHAVTGLLVLPNPHARGLMGRWVRLGEAWAVSGGCGAFGLFSRFCLGSSGGCNGGNCSIRGATRRRHAVPGLLVLPNPPFCSMCRRNQVPRWLRPPPIGAMNWFRTAGVGGGCIILTWPR